MATPLINPLRVQGGTFYSFSSAVKDIQKTFTDDDARFVFSKFALLNIPDVATPTVTNRENYIVWEALGSIAGGGTSSVPVSTINTDNNINIAQSFENYVLNFEELILKGYNTLGRAYDPAELYTTSERIFWRWMAQLNAIRFRNASTTTESTASLRYTEEDETEYYKRVVKYIGDIDVVNNVSRGGHAYSEVYVNVPTQHGNTPTILWKTFTDNNYAPGRQWNGTSEYIDGRDSGSNHPNGLDLRAFYDDDDQDYYESYTSFGNVSNVNLYTKASGGVSEKAVRLSRMDGAVLDFEPYSYTDIVNDGTITSISEYNMTDKAEDFTFNAALVYYDTYSASNPTDKATNLYGILILDDYVNSGSGESYLKRFDKFKPNKVTKLNGNGYSLKLDIRFDTSISNSGVETLINDYNTFSMDLFIDSSTRMQEAAEMFLDTELDVIDIKERLTKLENFMFSQAQIDELSQRISLLEQSLVNAKLAFSSSSTLLDLINKNADNINQILSGNLSVNLTYNTDVLYQGDGILLDKSVPNQVKIVNKNQGYTNFSVCKNSVTVYNPQKTLKSTANNGINPNSLEDNNILVLGAYTNYFKQLNDSHENVNALSGIEIFQDDLYINIDDASSWKKGQSFRIVFADPIDINNFTIYIKTDSVNKFGSGIFGTTVGTIIPSMLISDRPIIDIICTDESLYKFNIDIIR
jgi:hypothetical protein